VISQEIRSDRQIVDVVRTNINAQGEIGLELSYGVYDEWLQYALQSAAWSTQRVSTGSYSAVATGNKITRSTGSFVTDLVDATVGRWIKVTGFTNPSNNGYFKLSAISALELTLTHRTVVNEGPLSVTVTMGAHIANGTTLKTMQIEKQFSDLASEFELCSGMAIDSLNLEVAPEQIIAGAFGHESC
jgi:hypothetical protein